MLSRARHSKLAIVALTIVVFFIPVVVARASSKPAWSNAQLDATWQVLADTYTWLGSVGAHDAGADLCDSLHDSRHLLEAMVVMHKYYERLGDESEALNELNYYILAQCSGSPGGGTCCGAVAVAVPTPIRIPRGGGGTVNITNELFLAFLTMNEGQRAAFLQEVLPETQYELRTWIAENYTEAESVAATIGEISGVDNSLPSWYENPPAFDDFFDSFKEIDAFPELESKSLLEMEQSFDETKIFEGIESYIQ